MKFSSLFLVSAAIIVPLFAGATTFAATPNWTGGQRQMPAASGTVAAIDGDSVTLTAKNGTTYTVDVTNAIISKFTAATTGTKSTSTTISSADIDVGDTLTVVGTVSGDDIVATRVTDGVWSMGGKGGGLSTMRGAGNFNPVVIGTVTSVNGSAITLNDSSGTAYTIDVSHAKIETVVAATTSGARPTLSSTSVSAIAVNDTLNVFGTASGTNVTATQIIDGVLPARVAPSSTATPSAPSTNNMRNFTHKKPVQKTTGTQTSGSTTSLTTSEVTAVQKFLVSKHLLAWPKGVSYGTFGSLTQSALKKLQAGWKLPVTGMLDVKTRAALHLK